MTKLSIIVLSICCINISVAQNFLDEIEYAVKEVNTLNPDIGMSIGIILEGTQHFFNYGNINRKDEHKVNNETLFEIGSVTKLMTAYLIAQQVKLGKIELENYIDNYFSTDIELNSAIQKKIKVSDLASHQSGLPDFNIKRLIATNPEQPFDEVNKEMVDSILLNTSDLSSLGSYKYSNISYVLLGYILEYVCNDNYENILRDNLLFSNEMYGTVTSNFNENNNLTIGFGADNVPKNLFNWNNLVAPAGLVKSNTLDMLKFLEALLNEDNKLITNKLESTYFKNTFIELGLGLNILRGNEDVVYAKSGDSLGQSCVLGYNPEKKWGIVILTNQSNNTARQLFNELIKILK